MSLFRKREKPSDLKTVTKMVETVITELNLDPEDSRLEIEGGRPAWGLMKGSAEVFIFINPGQHEDDSNYIQIVSPVVKLPDTTDRRHALYEHILSLNARELTGAAFALKGDTVVLIADRSTIDLDPSEVKDLILRIGYYADQYDDQLATEFGGVRHIDKSQQ